MRNNLAGDLTAGLGAGLSFVPLIGVVGVIAFGALGPQTAAAMSAAVFAANIVAGTVVVLPARCPILVGGSSGAAALVLAITPNTSVSLQLANAAIQPLEV